MPGEASVVLLADRGFVGRQLCRYVRDRWNWHYRIRIKAKFWFWCPQGMAANPDVSPQPRRGLVIAAGERP